MRRHDPGMSNRRRPRPSPRRTAGPPRLGVLRGRPEEFAASLPEVLGFPPTESLVLLCFGGGGRGPKQLVFTLRVDLAEPAHDQLVAEQAIAHIRQIQPPPNRAMLFVVTEDPDDEVDLVQPDPFRVTLPRPGAAEHPTVPDLPRRGLVHAFVEQLAELRVATQDAVLVRAGRWWSYPDVDLVTGAGPGQALDVDGSRLFGIAALSGRTVDADRAATEARAWPTAPPTIAVLGACQRAEAELVRRAGEVDGPALHEGYWTDVEAALRAHAPGSRAALPADELARVGTGLLLVPVRDQALTLCATPTDDDAGDDLVAAAESLWTELVTRLPDDLGAVPALLLGYVAWLRGSGVLAVSALQRSLACEPTSMAEMLLTAVQGNTPPDVLRSVMVGPEDVGAAWVSGGSRPSRPRPGTPAGWPGSPRPR